MHEVRLEDSGSGLAPAGDGGTEHIFVGAGDGPCVILMVGARSDEEQLHYPIGLIPRSPSPGEPDFDLAWQDGDTVWVAEVKSMTAQNEEQQMRLAIGPIRPGLPQARAARGGRWMSLWDLAVAAQVG